MLKKTLIWGGITFLIFFVAFRPGAAVDAVKTGGHAVVSILATFGDFLIGIVS